eukprot:TRINITY_DN7903_c0_g1_i1.p1 TRINITY_DN7903_c0_g1~~TRINITY_DN7903_c0_g1_i1.p1  ORF type:complete len:250 (+),score=45.84 TRINITY_DN7903_c0_g1_i1:33-752(+)
MASLLVTLASLASIPPPNQPFSPMTYNSTVWMAFQKKKCLNTITLPPGNPYDGYNGTVPVPGGPDAVCAVKYTNDTERYEYYLRTYVNVSEAQGDGAFVTHQTACGVCSDLQDLAAFMSQEDLTDPIRQCGLEHLASDNQTLECILAHTNLTMPCAAMFNYNEQYTRDHCLEPCLVAKAEHTPNNLPPDNHLNPCLQCDEDVSGPIFKLYSGRNRRDSGLNSSIIRPPSQIFHVIHDYY